jgi:hypothetical protein
MNTQRKIIDKTLNTLDKNKEENLVKIMLSDQHAHNTQFAFHKNLTSPKLYREFLAGSDDEDQNSLEIVSRGKTPKTPNGNGNRA